MRLIRTQLRILAVLGLFSFQLRAEVCQYPNDPSLFASMNECNNIPGKEWSCTVNRCLTSQAAVDLKKDFEECGKSEEQLERKQCFQKLALQKTQEAEGPLGEYNYDNWVTIRALTQALATFHIVTSAVLTQYNGGNYCASMLLFIAGGVVGLGGEVYNWYLIKNESKDLENRYITQTFENNLEAQQQAFEFLAKEQDALSAVSKRKGLVYKIEAAVYGAVVVAALAEAFNLLDRCSYSYSRPDFDPKLLYSYQPDFEASESSLDAFMLMQEWNRFQKGERQSPGLDEYSRFSQSKEVQQILAQQDPHLLKSVLQLAVQVAEQFIPSAHAKNQSKKLQKQSMYGIVGSVSGSLLGLGMAGLLIATDKASGAISSYFRHPVTRAILAGVSAAVSAQLFLSADKQAKVAKSNARHLRKTAAKFTNVATGFCPNRKDPSNLNCFCYLPDGGGRDPDKVNSATCQKFFQQQDQNYAIKASDYSNSIAQKPLIGCVNRDRQFDPTCVCKNKKDSKGNNNCLSSRTQFQIGGFGSTLGLNGITSTADGVVNGNLTQANVNTGQLNQQAAQFKETVAKVLKQQNEKLIQEKKAPIPLKTLGNKIFDDVIKAVGPESSAQLASTFSNPAGLLASSQSSQNSQLNQAIDKVKKKSGLDSKLLYAKGSLKKNKSKSKDENIFEGLNFDGAQTSATGTKVINDFMQKKYDYKKDDIVDRPSTSLWQVISNRYFQSGLKRLFEEEQRK